MLRQCVHSWCGAVRPGVREEIIRYASAARLFVRTHVHSTCFTDERIGKDVGRANHSHGGEIVIAKASARETHLRKRPGSCEREGAFTCACSAAWDECVAIVAQAILAQGCERRFGFVAGCVHRMAPAACRPVIKCGKFGMHRCVPALGG